MENKTDRLEYKNYMNSLYDLYGNLLTTKQSEYFKAYYFDDLSLREIASDFNVSSNAVYDQIKNIEKTLEKYESILGLFKKCKRVDEILDNIDTELEKEISDEVKKTIKGLVNKLREEENK